MSALIGVIGLVVVAALYMLVWWKIALFVKTNREYYREK